MFFESLAKDSLGFTNVCVAVFIMLLEYVYCMN